MGVGTGGTISGVGRYLKERNPTSRSGASTPTAPCSRSTRNGIFDKNKIPYVTEGIGEDFLPENVDFSMIDHFEKVHRQGRRTTTWRIHAEEGIFALGNSAGADMAGQLQPRATSRKDDVGRGDLPRSRLPLPLGKIFNDDWMAKMGYLDRPGLTARDLVAAGVSGELLPVGRRQRDR